MTNMKMEYDAFLRAIALNPTKEFSFFLGAGASVESGVLSASECILEWKKRIYDSNNPNSSFRAVNFKAENCTREVQRWLDAQKIYPVLGDAEEYSFFAEKTYPDEADRCTYFNSKFSGVSDLSVGYKILAYFAKQGVVKKVWTTNFDDLVLKATVEQNVSLIDVTLDSADRVNSKINPNNLMLIKLHGDYKYSKMKNTSSELDAQESSFVQAITDSVQDTDLIVSGYSGRDKSVMSALASAFSKNGTGRLFWFGISKDPSESVLSLINTLSVNGRKAFYISCNGFDTMMLDIAEACYGNDGDRKKEIVQLTTKLHVENFKGFESVTGNIGGLLSINAFLIKCPKCYYQFTLNEEERKTWKDLRKSINASVKVIADRYKGEVYFLGDKAEIQKYFTRNLQFSTIPFDNTKHSQILLRLMRGAFIKSVTAQNPNLVTDGKRYIWDITKKNSTNIGNITYLSYDGIELEIGFCNKHSNLNLLTILPKCRIETDDDVRDKAAIKSVSDTFFMRVNRTYQSNSGVYAYIIDWHTTLTNGRQCYKFCFADINEMEFSIGKETALVGIMANYQGQINKSVHNRIIYNAIQYKDPELSFYNTSRTQLVEDFHPMRGLKNNAPYEIMYTPTGVTEDIKLAVILPEGEKVKVEGFLSKLNAKHQVERNAAYVLTYENFYNTYKIPLTIPPTNNNLWQEIQVTAGKTDEESCRLLAENIITAIKNINNIEPNCVIAIYIPKYLDRFDGYNNEKEKFDLHDYVKAFSIPKGISTQFIREKTIDYEDTASVAWTLSLAFYVKSGRTPWIINQITEEQTAFVGIGYSIDTKNEKMPIVVGCSHIFSADGQSIKYRLSRVKNPQFDFKDRYRENPYLTEDEAYRLGCRINDMFRKSFSVYPKRVVFHKRTPFKKCEVDGIVKSFSLYGITDIDLLTITYEDDIRAFQLKKDLTADNYPLKRGVGFVSDSRNMFLFTHGVANPLNQDQRYVMGGKSLPIPLKITKYYGNSSAEKIANDILGLTRMNWNNFNLYSKLPCTIESSNNIARIGYLLSQYDGAEYDYRLFI